LYRVNHIRQVEALESFAVSRENDIYILFIGVTAIVLLAVEGSIVVFNLTSRKEMSNMYK